MKKNKIYILELLLISFLFFTLFASNIFNRAILAIALLIYMFVVHFNFKKKGIHSIYKKQVSILMLIFSVIHIAVFYLLGLHYGFMKSKVLFSFWTIVKFIIPLSVIIISSEVIRERLLSQNVKLKIKSFKIDLSSILIYLSMVLIDLIIYTGVYDLTNLNDFLTALGFVLFSAISCNLLYNYISIRFGCKSIIIFRLITTLFIYIIPITPNVYIFLRTFLRMVYPYLIYLVLEKSYSKTNFAIAYKDKQKNILSTTIALTTLILLIMLISCQFKYGILVIGSRSMTGTIDIGDAVVFEKYDGQHIEKGQVIIFTYNNIRTVHRVVDIKRVNGEYHYFTKGDSNKKADDDYVTQDNILGLVKLKIKYIGYPTLWMRSLFD